MEGETQLLWKGKKIEELSKEELIAALKIAAQMIEDERRLNRQTLDLLSPRRMLER